MLNVKAHLAGKKGRCPKCNGRVFIPALEGASTLASSTGAAEIAEGESDPLDDEPSLSVSTATSEAPTPEPAMSDPIDEAPTRLWYVVPPGHTTQFGPADGVTFRGWIVEGRVTAPSLVWREGWAEWRKAGEVFPQLRPTQLPQHGTVRAEATPPKPSSKPKVTTPKIVETPKHAPLVSKASANEPVQGQGMSPLVKVLLAIIAGLVPLFIFVVYKSR